MSDDDEIEVVQTGDGVEFKDNETGAEYKVELGGDSEIDLELGDDEEGEDFDLGEEDDEEDVFEAVKSEPEPKPHNPTPNRAKTAKGKLSRVSAKKGQGGIKGTHTAEPQELGDKSGHTNTTGNTAKASGPSASKKATDAFC